MAQTQEQAFVDAMAKKYEVALKQYLTTDKNFFTRFWCYLLKNGEIVWTIDEGLVSTEEPVYGRLFRSPSELVRPSKHTDFGVTPNKADIADRVMGYYIFYNPSFSVPESFDRDDEGYLIRVTWPQTQGPRVSLEELLELKKIGEEGGYFQNGIYTSMVSSLEALRGESSDLEVALKRLRESISEFRYLRNAQNEDSD